MAGQPAEGMMEGTLTTTYVPLKNAQMVPVMDVISTSSGKHSMPAICAQRQNSSEFYGS